MTLEAYRSGHVRKAELPLLESLPEDALMIRAAHGLAHVGLRELRDRNESRRATGSRAVLLVGSGNNGGDALHAGAVMARRGVAVTALKLEDESHGTGTEALAAAGGRFKTFENVDDALALIARANIVIDGIVGIGAHGPLREPAASLVAAFNENFAGDARPIVVAADIPSGIGVDDGTIPGPAISADVTVTFGAYKPGLLLPPAQLHAGRVEFIDLGLEPILKDAGSHPLVQRVTFEDVSRLWPIPRREDHKYSRGVLGIVAGSTAYPGAAVLTVSGAFSSGVGMVRYVGPVQSRDLVLTHRPEVVAGGGRCQAWVLGPGVAPDDRDQTTAITRIIETCADDGTPCVVDAGGLEFVPGHVEENIVLTPHAGELVRLLEERGEDVEREVIEDNPARWARVAAEITGATVLLKGHTTVVARPNGTILTQTGAPSWLATAGAGDVLSGILGSLLASSAEAIAKDNQVMAELAAVASLIHGEAARHASRGGPVTALAVSNALPETIRSVLGSR